VSVSNLAKALAAYQRSLIAGDSPFDRYLFGKDTKAISAEAKRGFDAFLEVKCDACHLIMTPGLHPFSMKHVTFTDGKFHNLGVDAEKDQQDAGRFDVTGEKEDWGRFKTPTLRNIALTAPYFHDGSAATLADVVEFYDKGGKPNPNLDPALIPLKLTDEKKRDLVQFLESLTSSRAPDFMREAQLANPRE
jgi:cytochrome c peroxidase